MDRMFSCDIRGIELVALNTDAQDLKKVRAHRKIRIGKEAAQGLGTGMNPEIGQRAAQEAADEIAEALRGADMVFLAAGLGGGTGSGAAPVVAGIARSQGALTIAVVSKPFSFEGSWRQRIAERAFKELREQVDTLLVIPNDQILKLSDHETTVVDAFWRADEILRQAVQGISDLIARPGMINVDFADVKSIMKSSGRAVFGVGSGKGEARIKSAVESALHSPLLDMSIAGATGILFNVLGPDDLSLAEINEAAGSLKEEAAPRAKIIFGAAHDKGLKQGEVRVTVIATGFSS